MVYKMVGRIQYRALESIVPKYGKHISRANSPRMFPPFGCFEDSFTSANAQNWQKAGEIRSSGEDSQKHQNRIVRRIYMLYISCFLMVRRITSIQLKRMCFFFVVVSDRKLSGWQDNEHSLMMTWKWFLYLNILLFYTHTTEKNDAYTIFGHQIWFEFQKNLQWNIITPNFTKKIQYSNKNPWQINRLPMGWYTALYCLLKKIAKKFNKKWKFDEQWYTTKNIFSNIYLTSEFSFKNKQENPQNVVL